jgi:hypothetical protein
VQGVPAFPPPSDCSPSPAICPSPSAACSRDGECAAARSPEALDEKEGDEEEREEEAVALAFGKLIRPRLSPSPVSSALAHLGTRGVIRRRAWEAVLGAATAMAAGGRPPRHVTPMLQRYAFLCVRAVYGGA